MKSIGAILIASGTKLELDEFEIIRPLTPGQVLVKMISAGICRTQIREIDAPDGQDRYLPHLLGHEGYGEVLEVGANVGRVKPGDLVVLHWRKGSGLDADLPTYRWNGRKLNAGPLAVFASTLITSENRVTRVKSELPRGIAPLLGCALTTGWGVIRNDPSFQVSGQNILIIGVGGIGLSALIGAKTKNDAKITVLDKNKQNLLSALELGAHNAIAITDSQGEAAFLNENLGSFDLIVDTTGNEDLTNSSLRLLAATGRLIMAGMSHKDSKLTINANWLLSGKAIAGSNGGDGNPTIQIPEIIECQTNGQIDLKNYPVTFSKFVDINSALERLRSAAPGRQIIEFDF